jgi:hypothetical protein
MSNLTRSFVRGFGGFLGVMAAKKTVELLTPNPVQINQDQFVISDNSPQEIQVSKTLRKWEWFMILAIWAVATYIGFNLSSGNLIVTFIAFGILSPAITMHMFSGAYTEEDLILLEKQRLMKETYITEINQLVEKIAKMTDDRPQLNFEIAHRCYVSLNQSLSISTLHAILIRKRRNLKFLEGILENHGQDVYSKIISGEDPWNGMTEKQLDDLRAYSYYEEVDFSKTVYGPTEIEVKNKNGKESRTLIYGNNKYSGDWFRFENNSLIEFRVK